MTCNTCNECNPCEKENKPCCELKVLAGDCVDVEEVNWAYVVSATCPPRVVAWEWVEVDRYLSPREWYSYDYEVSAIDKKVGVCDADWNPSTLDEKLRVETWWPITRKVVWCGESSNGYMELWFDQSKLSFPDEKVAVKSWCEWKYLNEALVIDSNIIQAKTVGCELRITDKSSTFYDNNVCIWFDHDLDRQCTIDNISWNMNRVDYIQWDWNRCTWNSELATRNWIRIKSTWYYRVTWQLTVQFNIWDECYINLWRAFLKITWDREIFQYVSGLSTAKHWGYTISPIMYWGEWIKTTNMWEVKFLWEWEEWESQSRTQLDWPWATYNIDCLVDLYAWDVITLWWRGQGSMLDENWQVPYHTAYYRFVWFGDQSTEFQSIFWWTTLSVQMVAPRTFQDNATNKLREAI